MVDSKKLGKSFGYALSGFVHTLGRQQNMRIGFLCAGGTIVAALLLRVSRIEFIVVVCAIFLVLFAEMINTVIEETLDVISEEHHPGIKIAKDVAAGASLLMVIFSAIVGGVIFIPHILEFLYR